tara:strand:+ start:3761 stop:6697 length:2937 start_codon:yes stop_codon:yes gene_type:complete
MPKQVQLIKEFDGGLNSFAGTRDIGEKECSSINGWKVRKVGELLPLGGFKAVADTVIDNISEEIGPDTDSDGTGNPVRFDNGAQIFEFTADHTRSNTEATDRWLIFVDKLDGRVYIHADSSSPLVWEYLDPDNISEFKGIDGILCNATNMTSYDAREASYYFVDGKLRICDPNYNNATYIGDQSSSHGASSLWFGHIKKGFLANTVPINHWHCLPAAVPKPVAGQGAGNNFLNLLSFATGSGGPDVEAGQFGLNAYIERDKGDGTLQFQGRKIYVTYTIDGAQETLPTYLDIITESDLPDAPTNADLGYEQITSQAVQFGQENIPLNNDVRALSASERNWDEAGTVTVEDEVGMIQTLTYSSIVDGTNGLGNSGGSTLAGITGWVDNGSCSINKVVDNVALTNPGSGYSSAPSVNFNGGDPETSAAATAVLDSNGSIDYITITNPGDGYDSIPTVTFSTGGATAIASITGNLSSESYCVQNGGSWTDAGIAASQTVTFDVPGELEQRDENLGVMFTLTVKPLNYASANDWGDTIIANKYGGNRITHINIYSNKYEDDAGTIPQTEDMAFMCSWDLENGFKKSDGSFNAWQTDNALSSGNHADQKSSFTSFIGSLLDDNYQTRTGMFPDTNSTDIRWLDAVVVNRRVYAGNVMCKDETGSYKSYPDKVLKSIPNAFDSFPLYDSLDVVVDDGDEITGLESWGGKLLQFKKKSMYLIDITSEPEFLAATFRYRGIPHKNAKCKTDEGVAFANANGVFMFNGESILKLSKGKIDDDWQAYYNSDILVGFEPRNQNIVITNDTDEFFVYDMLTKSWTKGDGNRHTDTNKSNMFIVGDDLAQAAAQANGSVIFYKYKDLYDADFGTNGITDVWESREMDFGNPSNDSFVYNIKLSYSSNGSSNVEVRFIGNDGTGEVEYETNYSNGTVLPTTSGDFNTIEIKSSASVKCKTFKVQVRTAAAAAIEPTFKITDLAVIYRDKRIR